MLIHGTQAYFLNPVGTEATVSVVKENATGPSRALVPLLTANHRGADPPQLTVLSVKVPVSNSRMSQLWGKHYREC